MPFRFNKAAAAACIFLSLVFAAENISSTKNITSGNILATPNLTQKYNFDNHPEDSPKEKFKNLSIEADFVNYAEKNDYVQASGNVLMVYKDYRLTANVTTVNMKTEQLYISDGFVFNRSLQRITGEKFFYDFTTEEGYGTDVDMFLNEKIIKGKNVLITKEKLVVDDAWESTCPRHPQCNHITSKRTTIYPEWGDIVHDNAVIYFFFVPVMYVPNYVSSARGSANDMMYSAIPRFGSNRVEGNFAKAGLSYYTNEKLNGSLDIHYLSKLGARVGFTNNYKLSQSESGQLRAHYTTGLGGRFSFGWQHRSLLGVPYKTKKEIIDDFFRGVMPPSNDTYTQFVTEVSNRELDGNEWISYRPKLSLLSPHYQVLYPGIYNYFTLSLANIYEEDPLNVTGLDYEGNRGYVKSYWDYNIYRDFGLGYVGRIVPSITYMKSGYYEGSDLRGAWKRFYYNLNYYKDWWKFNARIGYKNTFSESGYSPFKFDAFNMSTPEESSYELGYQALDNLKVSYAEFYSITDRRLRDKSYSLNFKACCWNISLSWWDSSSQFTFGISMN